MTWSVSSVRNALATVALAGTAISVPAFAQNDSPFSITGSVTFTSDYRWRGMTQTDEHAAVQGELNLRHNSGLYVGAWGSNVDYNDPDLHLELDTYIGFARKSAAINYDVGIIYYQYPGSSDSNYWELYGDFSKDLGLAILQGGVQWTNDFDGADIDQYYYYGGVQVPVGPVGLYGQVGHTDFEGSGDWTHWQLGAAATLAGLKFDLSYHDVDRSAVGDSAVVFSVKKSF